jgi:superfamily II DNA or RNA helicase
MRRLRFDRGTLLLDGFPAEELPNGCVHDPRVGMWRASADRYFDLVLQLHQARIPYEDEARDYGALDRTHQSECTPRDYQLEAVSAWHGAGRRGVVVLPTGSGKSFVAELCIDNANRATLVVAPTLDLVGQWYDRLRRAFGDPVGVLGGGSHEVHDITVSTYDSAWMHIDRYGARFGLVIYDECHHLPGATYSQSATGSIAPFRLGLSATPERSGEEETGLDHLVGPIVYRREIGELAGEFLADYRTELLTVALSQADREAYDEARGTYREFVDSRGLRLGGQGGWHRFLREAARSREGRAAHRAWMRSRRILQGAPTKLRMLEELLRRHRDGRVIVFTNDNATVYEISRRLLLPAITHQTDLKERRAMLAAFADGRLPVIVTSKVLNEGVDIPSADVAIVLSGTATVREHVQRLGRILRKQEGKQAVLYELVVEDSAEERTSARRREHAAYQS